MPYCHPAAAQSATKMEVCANWGAGGMQLPRQSWIQGRYPYSPQDENRRLGKRERKTTEPRITRIRADKYGRDETAHPRVSAQSAVFLFSARPRKRPALGKTWIHNSTAGMS